MCLKGVSAMRINYNTLNYKTLLKLLDGQLDSISNASQKINNKTTDKREMDEHNKTKSASNKILNLLEKLNEQDRKILISNLIRYNIPLETEKMERLVSYLRNKAEKDNSELIKSFILLSKNKIPISKSLLEGVGDNFKQENSLSEKLNKLINITRSNQSSTIPKENDSMQKENRINGKPHSLNAKPSLESNLFDKQTTQKNNPPLNIIRHLLINTSSSEKTLIDQLKEYPEQLSKYIQLLQEQGGNSQEKIMQHLIGQQLINHQDKNLLLNLEIPIFFPQYKKSIPTYLNIRRDSNSESRNNNSSVKNYKINFIISLKKRGIIKAETFISTGRIKIFFTCNKKETTGLIKSEFINLKESLEAIGISVEKTIIKYSNINSDDMNTVLSSNIGIDQSQIDDFLHIDIKV